MRTVYVEYSSELSCNGFYFIFQVSNRRITSLKVDRIHRAKIPNFQCRTRTESRGQEGKIGTGRKGRFIVTGK